MGLPLEKPIFHLQLLTGNKPQRTIEVVPPGGSSVGQFAEKNQAKLEELRQRREKLLWKASFVGLGGAASMISAATKFAFMLLGSAASLPAISSLLGELQTTSQRFLLMADLIEAFEDEDVSIEVGLEGEGIRAIDFFLKFPDKEYILIQIRSMGGARITYSEAHEALRFQKKRSIRSWNPDPLAELSQQERWLRRQQPDLFGTSSNDRRRPLSKLLVLWTDTRIGDHPEHLYDTIDDQKYLTIRKVGTTNMVTRDQTINFIRSYLNFRRRRKTSNN